jgi:predicted transcriptional regulator
MRRKKNTAAKARRDRWRARVVEGMTPALRAELSPAEVMYLWASATNGDKFFFAGATIDSLVAKGLVVRKDHQSGHGFTLTPTGARWALRVLEVYGEDPSQDPARWVAAAGVRRTKKLAAQV